MTEQEVLQLDNKLRGKIYINSRSNNKYFLHCVVQDLDDKTISVIVTNATTGKMIAFKYLEFNSIIEINNKRVPRFILDNEIEKQKIENIGQPDTVKRLQQYNVEETKKRFSFKDNESNNN